MKVLKHAVHSDINEINNFKKFLYANVLKSISDLRSDDDSLYQITDVEVKKVTGVSSLSDGELTPENGFYILGHRPPITGALNKESGFSLFSEPKEITGGDYGLSFKVSWAAPTTLLKSKLTDEQAVGLNATLNQAGTHYSVPSFTFDFSGILSLYTGPCTITDTEPEYV